MKSDNRNNLEMGKNLGAIHNYLGLLSEDNSKVYPKTLMKVAGMRPGVLSELIKISRTNLYRDELPLPPTKEVTKRVIHLVVVGDLVFELLKNDKEQTIKWLQSPNASFFGSTPIELCFRGDGEKLINWLLKHLGRKPGTAF